MSEDGKAVIRNWVEAVNRQDVEAALSLFAPDYRDNTSEHEGSGVETLRGSLRQMFGAFPDLQYTAEEVIAEGEKVVERFSSVGTHRGELMGTPPTGKQVTITGINIYRLEGGKIAERWAQIDDIGMMQQLGLGPAHHSHDPSGRFVPAE